jgi:RNA polymerase subunit RPABC4/transcription elongation factor Spt4
MTLIACPRCGRKVLSVASVCPNCSFSLTEQRAIDAQRGSGIRCHQCQQALPASTSVCPHCGEARRSDRRRRWLVPGVGLAVVIAVALYVLPKIDADQPQQNATSTAERQLAARPDSVPPQPQATVIAEESPATSLDSAPARSPTTFQRTRPVSARSGGLTEIRWASDYVNVRELRAVGSDIVRVLSPGERVEVGLSWQGWWAVFVNGQPVGYVDGSYLQDQPPSG